MLISRPVYKAILIAFLNLTFFIFSAHAQDYRANSRPREMVQPAPQQRGIFDLIFGRRQAEPEPQYQMPRVSRAPSNSYVNPDRNHTYPTDNRNYISPDKKIKVPVTKVGAQGTGLYCVRSCDGFFFPIANPSKVVDGKNAQQDACNTLCPGAEVEVYKSSSHSIEEAVNSTTRKSYKAHPKAFAFREKIENSCSCKGYASRGLARIPYNKDYTLKAGDVVLLDNGAHVFSGGDFPYKNRDFASVSRGSSRLSPELRQMMVAKNVPMGTTSSQQVASKQQNILADSTSLVDLEPLSNGYSKSVRTIDILGKVKERPVLVIDIIQQIKQSRS